MSDAPPEQPQTREGGLSIETLIKVAAVLGAASLLLGITYNISFFAGEKSPWLFYVSAADNLVSTMYALPYGLLVGAFVVVSTWFVYRGPPLKGLNWPLVAVIFAFIFSPLLTMWALQGLPFYDRLGLGKTTGATVILIVSFTAATCAVPYGAAWVIRRAETSGTVGLLAFWPVGLAAMLALLVGAAFVARLSRAEID